ncbi:hypothetical protein QE370_000416 [Aeromicrobium sp. SORGH_AS981]|uniref:hypothetical protein n=1 Tax=Aeromicrobium sp. SORGH_AS_0981 TaxID=3041802 RepID=UPI002862B232|nr:hypothetical protein [Aeromicrobium sp. SORGH_AS_0981]MDR6117232.1 hypothetical protein [Aeromicrobium sp. SORGH_AS_0981]
MSDRQLAVDTAPTIACDQCTGNLIYRVKLEDFAAEQDNFDQLSDHRPGMFTNTQWLAQVARGRGGKVTVWRLADADRGGDWAEDVMIAYAGPHPSPDVPGRTWMTDLSGYGYYDELEDARCEGHESLDGAHMGESVFCDGSCQVRL